MAKGAVMASAPALPFGVSDETRHRTMMRHGSGMLLRALRGEPEPVPFRPRARVRFDPAPPGTIARGIIREVADAFSMEPNDLTGESRKADHIIARFVAIRLIRDRTWSDGTPRFSTTRIGGFFNRDHSTIGHALCVFEIKMKQFPQAAEIYEALRDD